MPTGWRGSTRRSRLPGDWHIIRRNILDRDGHQCQHIRYDTGRKCLAPSHEVDHIVENDDDSPENLHAICPWHHRQKTGRHGGRRSGQARKAKAKAQRPKHPGLID